MCVRTLVGVEGREGWVDVTKSTLLFVCGGWCAEFIELVKVLLVRLREAQEAADSIEDMLEVLSSRSRERALSLSRSLSLSLFLSRTFSLAHCLSLFSRTRRYNALLVIIVGRHPKTPEHAPGIGRVGRAA